MTDQEFKKNTNNKDLTEFTRQELYHACSYAEYETIHIVSIAKEKGWNDVVKEALSYETEYNYFGHKLIV